MLKEIYPNTTSLNPAAAQTDTVDDHEEPEQQSHSDSQSPQVEDPDMEADEGQEEGQDEEAHQPVSDQTSEVKDSAQPADVEAGEEAEEESEEHDSDGAPPSRNQVSEPMDTSRSNSKYSPAQLVASGQYHDALGQ